MSRPNTENTQNVLSGKLFTTLIIILFDSRMREKNWRGERKTETRPSRPPPLHKIHIRVFPSRDNLHFRHHSLSFCRVLHVQGCRESSRMWTESLIETCLECATLVWKCRVIKTVVQFCIVANVRRFVVLKIPNLIKKKALSKTVMLN